MMDLALFNRGLTCVEPDPVAFAMMNLALSHNQLIVIYNA